jgi:SAM-dependent methyltransferase
MLRDAALLTLELTAAALEEGMILKDASPYNVQWRGAVPVFIDVGSFERLPEGEPWFGYRQFCMQFLYPLMLQSYREVPYRPLLRGELEGISPEQMRHLLSLRDRFRRGVLTNVVLHARLERRHSERSARTARAELKRAGFKPELIKANVDRLARLVRRLDHRPGRSEWSEYREISTYDEAELRAKEGFVESAVAGAAPRLVWDLGCNDGRFSRIAAAGGAYVIAVDSDEVAVDRLYRELRGEGAGRILPLAVDLVDSSPGMGWRGTERPRLEDRARPDLVLALALVHHLAIGANVPLAAIVDWLGDLGAALVIEFPTREDPMVTRLLSRKREGAHPDYELEGFEELLARRFAVARREAHGTRVLFEARPL